MTFEEHNLDTEVEEDEGGATPRSAASNDVDVEVIRLPLLPAEPPEEWDAAAVSTFLQRRGLPKKLCSMFVHAVPKVNGLQCKKLKDHDLENMGVDNVFHRRRVLREFLHLFNNWPASCKGWLIGKPLPRDPRLRPQRNIVWPPPRVRVRPGSAPSRGQCSSFGRWQRKTQEFEEEEMQVYADGVRVAHKQEHQKEIAELKVLGNMFNEKSGRNSLQYLPGAELVAPANTDAQHVKKQLMQVRQKAHAQMQQRLLEAGGNDSSTARLSFIQRMGNETDLKERLAGELPPLTPKYEKRNSSPRAKKVNKQLNKQRRSTMNSHKQMGKQPSTPTQTRSGSLDRKTSKTHTLHTASKRTSMEIMEELSQSILAQSEDEAEMRLAFARYAHGGLIPRKQLWHALADLGLMAKHQETKKTINQWFELRYNALQEEGALEAGLSSTFLMSLQEEGKNETPLLPPEKAMLTFQFAVIHVADVRRVLNDDMRKEMLEHFATADADNSGLLDIDEVVNALSAFELCPKSEDDLNDLLLAINEIDRDNNGIDFGEFMQLAFRVRVHLNAERRRQQRHIAEEAGLTNAMFFELRSDIIDLRKAFSMYDRDSSGHLHGHEITRLLLDIGLAPKSAAQRLAFQDRLCESVDMEGCIHVPEYFNLCYSQRIAFEEEWHEKTASLFRSGDRDNSGLLEYSEVGQVLVRLGLQPRSKEEQKEIGEIVEEADIDGSGTIDLEEFQTIVQRVSEKLQKMQRERDEEFASALGFSKERYMEFREAYEEIMDVCEGGAEEVDGFEISGLRYVVTKLRKPVTSTALRSLFTQLDLEGMKNGRLGIFQFMQFMWIIETNAFDCSTGKITQSLPTKIHRKDLQRRDSIHSIKPIYEHRKEGLPRSGGDAILGQGAYVLNRS